VSASTVINPDKLAEFFVDKVEGVRAAAHEGMHLSNFRDVSIEELRQERTRSPVKSSALDPVPTFIQRKLVDVTPTVRSVVNAPMAFDCISGQVSGL